MWAKTATLCLVILHAARARAIDVVTDVDVEAYVGLWYQTATSRSTAVFGTGVDYSCVTATYACAEGDCTANNITVLNEGLDAEGQYKSISGFSYCEDGAPAAKRKVHFNGVPFDGSYWIVKLGPVVDGKYDYAVVSGPLTDFAGTTFTLYVLARDPASYEANYEEEVMAWTEANGFDWYWNRYVKTDQSNCDPGRRGAAPEVTRVPIASA